MPEHSIHRDALVNEAKRIEEDALFSARGHWEAARTWQYLHYWIGLPSALLAALAGLSSLTDHPILAGVLAFTVAATTAIGTFLKTKQRHLEHVASGSSYKELSNRARIFRQIDCLTDTPSRHLGDMLKELDARRNHLNATSSQIPRRAYLRAKAGLEQGEGSYAVDIPRQTEAAPGTEASSEAATQNLSS